MSKIIEILKILLGIAFIVFSGLFSWCACILSSRYEEGEEIDREDTKSDK